MPVCESLLPQIQYEFQYAVTDSARGRTFWEDSGGLHWFCIWLLTIQNALLWMVPPNVPGTCFLHSGGGCRCFKSYLWDAEEFLQGFWRILPKKIVKVKISRERICQKTTNVACKQCCLASPCPRHLNQQLYHKSVTVSKCATSLRVCVCECKRKK